MRQPCETLQQPFYALVRQQLILTLKDNGFNQLEIANMLSVSQPLVSRVLRKGIVAEEDLFHLVSKEIVNDVLPNFLEHGKDAISDTVRRICVACKNLRTQGPACTLHISSENFVPLHSPCTDCRSSKPLQLLTAGRYKIVSELIVFSRQFSELQNCGMLIPEIGLQVAYGLANPQTTMDVVAFPVRMMKVGTGCTISGEPMFGASSYTAGLVLGIASSGGVHRCAAGLKYTEELLSYLERVSSKGGENYDRVHGSEKKEFFKSLDLSSDLIYIPNSPSIGLEGIIYVASRTPSDLYSLVRGYLAPVTSPSA